MSSPEEKSPPQRIPDEIFLAFNQEIGFSLLVKGEAGVGKTTFALELLNLFESPIYVSTRVAPTSLYQQFPWLRNHLLPENIIDATQTFLPPYHESDALRTHIKQTLRFNSIPDFLKIIYAKIEQYGTPTIVVDSWDAILGTLSPENLEKTKMETLLTEFVRQMNVRLILVSESVERSFLDYIVDGIITLRDDEQDARVLRSLELNKMRGIMRRQKKYAFTLYENHFQFIPPFQTVRPENISPWVVDPDGDDLFSTGNPDLNVLYGNGLKPGTFNLLEVSSDIPEVAYAPIFLGFICNYLSQKRGCIVQTMEGINSELIDKKRLFLYEDTENINSYLRILMERVSDRNEIRPYIVQIDKSTYQDTFVKIYEELSSLTRFQPVFAGIAYDTLSFQIDYQASLEHFYKHLKIIKSSNIIELGILNSPPRGKEEKDNPAGSTSSLINDISYLADTHMKIISQNGAIIVYGIKPYSGTYHLDYSVEEGFPRLKLVPIV